MREKKLKDDWETTHPGLAAPGTGRPPASLEAPDGVAVESPAVWLPSRNELAWRIRPEAEGRWDLAITVGEETYTKSLDTMTRPERRAPERLEPTFWNQLIYPAEAALPGDSPLKSIGVPYATEEIALPGFRMHWLIVFFVLSIVFAFALKDRFGVRI